MNKSTLKYLLLLVNTFYLFSCANISSPTGGEKDLEAPKLIEDKSIPRQHSLNYQDNVIELNFDERIEVENLQEQLLITPLEENPYKIIVKKNKLRLQFEKPFSPNTTYTFNFREGIKDMTEGNFAENLVLSFSTGPFLDSIYISGTVTDLSTNLEQDNMLISLYRSADTLSPLNSKPIYLAKSVNAGSFSIQNIKSGTYDLYAIDDKNKNMKYEETERLAFLKAVPLDSSLKNLTLKLSLFDSKPPVLKRTKSNAKTFEIPFNEGVHKVSIKEDDNKDMLFKTSKDGKLITIYNTYNKEDSISINIQLSDSTGNELNQKMKIAFIPQREEKEFLGEEFLIMEIKPTERLLDPGQIEIEIIIDKPVTTDNSSQIIIKEDTLIQSQKRDYSTWKDNSSLEIIKKTKAKDSIVLIVPEKTFSFQNNHNLSDTIVFGFKKEENYGSIGGEIKTEKQDYIIELLNSNYKVVETLINPKTFKFTSLQPGTYIMRAIEDENKNKLWDKGNLKESKQPEPMYFLKNKIDLRANWEIQDIKFEF